MVFRLSTLSTEEENGVAYQSGDLSVYPEALDDHKSLYIATNNSETKLKQSLTYNGKYIIVDDATGFPSSGLLRIGRKNQAGNHEFVYYDKRNNTTFMNLVRGHAGSIQSAWAAGDVYVSNSVMADHHNAIKDAALNIEKYVGIKDTTDETSLNGILQKLEARYLSPKPQFRAFPLKGGPGLKVRFQNFSNTETIRFLWDFGDGTTSDERSPTHTYQSEGVYTIKLNMIMSTGAQGVVVKRNYITVSEKQITPFFYADLKSGSNEAPATFEFVDQTDGDIANRYWVFNDGESAQITSPNIHTIEHTYTTPGNYTPSLLIVFKDQSLKRVFLKEGIQVTE